MFLPIIIKLILNVSERSDKLMPKTDLSKHVLVGVWRELNLFKTCFVE